MAQPQLPAPSLLFAAVFSRHDAALGWADQELSARWGQIRLRSPRLDHSETRYYETEMGQGLKKQFLVFDGWFDPQRLPTCKLESNSLEMELVAAGVFAEQRPVNIDPGYLTLSKLVLASAKDRAHRLYLADGIYGEPCLYFLDGTWHPWPWTYPDYCREDFRAFFVEARELIKSRMSNHESEA